MSLLSHPTRRALTLPRTLVAVPMYNCAPQIGRVLAQFTPAVAAQVSRVLLIDNRSTDDGAARVAKQLATMPTPEILFVRNRENYGLGGSHKVAFAYALRHGFDRVVILHGDDQGRITDLLPALSREPQRDAWLGARFMPGSTLHGYSLLRTLGNRAFNALFSAVTRRRVFDLGSGLNAYNTNILRNGFYRRFPDDLTFNYVMVLAHVARRHDFSFVPIEWREQDQRSNVRLVSQAVRVLTFLMGSVAAGPAFVDRELRTGPLRESYDADPLEANFAV